MMSHVSRRSRWYRPMLWAVIFLAVALTTEMLARVIFRMRNEKAFSSPALMKAMEEAVDQLEGRKSSGAVNVVRLSMEEAVHPYFGYVFDPERMPGLTDDGFVSPDHGEGVPKRGLDRLVVGLFGGSFAQEICSTAFPYLKKTLEDIAENVEIHCFGLGGYKQPQQLEILAYLFAQGAEFDVVINIDGFNDIVLPVVDNVPFGVNPFYPRGWQTRLNVPQGSARRDLAVAALFSDMRSSISATALYLRFSRSAFLSLLWQAVDRSLGRAVTVRLRRAEEVDASSLPFSSRGPRAVFADDDALFDALAQFWRRSSLAMARLCSAYNTTYLHFLQPNQYVSGSKPMTEKERLLAFDEQHPYKAPVERGYHFLRDQGELLQKEGVAFFDLVDIFHDRTDVLYRDVCCHLNEAGYQVVADEVVRRFLQTLPSGKRYWSRQK